MGVSNVSFGLTPAARSVINSVMLHHAVKAGLDMAIVNPSAITPYAEIPDLDRALVDDLIFNRHPEALQKVIEHFQAAVPVETKKDNQAQMLAELAVSDRLQWKIVHRYKEEVEKDVDLLLADKTSSQTTNDRAVEILNTILLPAMKEVGDKFGSGELILPFVLQSAEVMKKTVSYLEQYLDRKEGVTKGTLVLATVYGDVHDIGKNLVKTILSNNGYTVVDLGKQVPAETIIEKAIEINADAIGLSALLVSTSKQMPLIVNELHRRGLKFPFSLAVLPSTSASGAGSCRPMRVRIMPVASSTARMPLKVSQPWKPLAAPNPVSRFIPLITTESKMELDKQSESKGTTANVLRSNIVPSSSIPKPTTWGVRVVKDMPLEVIFKHLSKNELFRLSWGGRNTHGEEWVKLQQDFESRLESMTKQALAEKWLKPQAVYGIWPAQSEGNDLIVYAPTTDGSTPSIPIKRFTFARQIGAESLCLADYFASVSSGQMDVVAFQVVTVGQAATQRFERLQNANDYTEAYFTHGLAVQTAEATADYLHEHIRRELGIAPDQGKRYSWGYPAIPDMPDHRKVFDLLPVEKELGMSLTSAYQLVPEQSTAAIIVHHPEAKYYNIGESRVDQLMRAAGS